MTSATDLITYIGVPLTVAGVLPLLWNMILAIRIWLKLKNSIPLRYRGYYSLLPDPAAGKVTVVARTPSLELPGLWSTKTRGVKSGKTSLLEPKTALPSLADHVAFVPIAPAVSGFTASGLTTKDHSITTSFRNFNIPKQGLLGRTWMTLADRCALVLGSPQDDENAYGTKLEREEEDEVRFSVQSDMNANAPTPLRMNWAQFIWLSLALGIYPYDSAWDEKYPCTLKDSYGNALVTLFESEGLIFARIFTERDISYSLNRAFAWHNVILETEGVWPLGWQRKSHVPLSSVQISPGLSTLLNTDELEHCAGSVLRGKEAQDCEHPLASACRWMLYHRRHRSITGESIPVSQQMMEFRERALCHLHLLDQKGQLEGKIWLLMWTTPESKELVATGDEIENMTNDESPRDMEPQTTGLDDENMCVIGTPIDGQANATVGSTDSSHEAQQHILLKVEQSDLDPQAIDGLTMDKREATPCDNSQGQPDSLASAMEANVMSSIDPDHAPANWDDADGRDSHPQPFTAINSQSTSSTTSSGTGATKDGLPNHVNTQNWKPTTEPVTFLSASQSKAASAILDAIRSAIAASIYVKRFETLLSIRSEILRAFFKLSEPGPRHRVLYKFRPSEMLGDAAFGPALMRLARFSIECNELDTLTDSDIRRSKMIDIYGLFPHIHRARLESAVLAQPSPSSILGFDSSDDTSFIASVALATAEWDTVIHQAWRLDTEAMNSYEALTSKWRANVLGFGNTKRKCLESQRAVQLEAEVATTALINNGLYKAPESSELDSLLVKEVRKVCLL